MDVKSHRRWTFVAGAFALASLTSPSLAAELSTELDTVTVIGDSDAARELPGSAAVVDKEQMTTEVITDVHQALKTVPGVYIHEEEGFGLRPRIGIRAAAPGRSNGITLMEDGVLSAPAPYASPAAYYFPTTLRMHSIEVLKGAPLLRYGPQTVGGVVNLVSTPIPEYNQGRLMAMLNQKGSLDLYANYGGKSGPWGYMLETVQRNNKGYKELDRYDDNTGFQLEDYVGKLSWEDERNLVLFKFQRSLENSDETYLGLADTDFRRDENRRYGLSNIDEMDNQHTGISLSHTFAWSDNISSTITAYQNKFKRNWFKSDGKNPETGNNIIDDANAGNADALAILHGTRDVAGLAYKNNSREYKSRGVQANINWLLGQHDFNIGARVHHDQMDRFQPTEIYDQVDGRLLFQGFKAGELKGSNNSYEEADAWSAWITDDWQLTDKLNVNLALRVEDVETERNRYAMTDRSVKSEERANSYREYLPGIAATYQITDDWQVLAGYHEGMTPLGGGSVKGEKPEKSDNYEVGLRFNSGVIHSEAIAFYSDFDNKAELCSIGSPCSNGKTYGTSVIGGAKVKGVEFQAGTVFNTGNLTIPVDFMYTYTKAETTGKGGAESGLELQNVPENIASLRVGLEHRNGWNNYLVAKYIDKTCAVAGCNKSGNKFDETDALTTVDLISRYQFTQKLEGFVKVENLFDRQEIISRSPYGARPNLERTVWAGVAIDF